MRAVKRLTPIRFLLIAFVLLCIVYAWATPIFEASDELWHFGLVDQLARTWTLPVQQVGAKTVWQQEGSQPPLYYLIAAVLVSPIDRSDIDSVRQPNPHTIAGIPHAFGNKNVVLHDIPHPALQGTALAVYVVRAFSIVLGAVTVFMVYASTRLLAYQRPEIALFAAALTAFNPMFLFITASVNNDNLVTALDSIVIFLMLVLLVMGFSTRRSVALGVLLALSSLSKLSGLVLIPVVALAGIWTAYRRRDWRGLLTLVVAMIGTWSLLAGWWYLRNLALYGELFGTHMMASVAGLRPDPFTAKTLLNEFEGFRISYWGLFGGVNILTIEPFYKIMDGFVFLALMGLIVLTLNYRQRLRRQPSDTLRDAAFALFLLALTFALGIVGVISWTAQTYASQGRLLFPYVAAISPLLAFGIDQLLSVVAFIVHPITKTSDPPQQQVKARRAVNSLLAAANIAFAAFALVVPFASIAPQYAPPTSITALPDTARRVYARFGDVALIGYEAADRRYQPGEALPITLYWQVLQHSEKDYSLFVTALNEDGNAIGKIDSFPGAGRLRTTTWQPNSIYADPYAITLSQDAQGRFPLRVQIGWWDYASKTPIMPTDENGKPLQAVLLDVGALVDPNTRPQTGDLTSIEPVTFGGAIRLLAYQRSNDHLLLLWESAAALPDDYAVFAQVLDDQNHIVGQGDTRPTLPTHYWQPGERYLTQHSIVYSQPPAAGTYRLVIGWYRVSDLSRLSTDAPDNAYVLTSLSLR